MIDRLKALSRILREPGGGILSIFCKDNIYRIQSSLSRTSVLSYLFFFFDELTT